MSITKEQLLNVVNTFNERNEYSFTIVQKDKFVEEQYSVFEYCENEIDALECVSCAYEYFRELIVADQSVDSDEVDFNQYK